MSFENDTLEQPSFVRHLTGRARPVDILLVGLVPVVLGAVYMFPVGVRQSLAFEYTDPSLLTAFVSNFVHLDAGHLRVNLAVYALVVPVSYALSVASGRRQRFYTAFATFLLAFPFVLSYLNLVYIRSAVAVGFSGVTMAFVGYLPFALAEYADETFDVGPESTVAPALFFASLALIAPLSVRPVVPENGTVVLATVGLVLAASLSALLYALPAYDRNPDIRATIVAAVDEPGYFELVAVGTVLFVALPFVAFPADPVTDGGILNLYVHLLGYTLGFMVPYVTAEAVSWLGSTTTGM